MCIVKVSDRDRLNESNAWNKRNGLVQMYADCTDLVHSSPVVKGSVVSSRGPFTSSKQWSLYTATLNTHWVRVGRVVTL